MKDYVWMAETKEDNKWRISCHVYYNTRKDARIYIQKVKRIFKENGIKSSIYRTVRYYRERQKC